MSNDNKIKPDPKKGLPGGFIVFLLATILIILTVQNLTGEKSAKVSFSHEVEHLVNLDLIQPEDSRKIALNDNLVTFTGRFKERVSEDSKGRYKYLELLNRNHELTGEKQRLDQDLIALKQNVRDSADWFLHLSGLPIPKNGYVVVGTVYDTAEKENAVIIKKLTDKDILSLADLEKRFSKLSESSSDTGAFGRDLLTLVQGFRSPALGIGNEDMKQQLKNIEQQIASTNLAFKASQTAGSIILTASDQTGPFSVYRSALDQLTSIVSELDKQQDNTRLLLLRSVRTYTTELQQYSTVYEELDKNEAQLDKSRQSVASVIWFFNNKELSTRALEKQDPEVFSHWFSQTKQEWSNFTSNKGASFKAPDQPRNTVLEKTFKSEEPSPNYFSYLLTILPVVFVILLLYFVFSRQMKGVGASAINFGKSPARLLTKDRNKITFRDVAGCDEAKEELQEIVDFLKDPTRFTALGARIPKGVLLIGAPGTGKTLIAKAVAGEADRPFFSISGSDFVEMFVGVGASRIRDLFDQAKKNAPCIIFMDEIDAVGRHRGAGIGGGHDEREQTLNQLLVEMDGFDTSEGVILIAATNRPDVLDKALLRPGRFDRRVVIDLPDIKGRHEILKVHARKIKLDKAVDLLTIARNTPGASGADLENILNEAALLAARKGRNAVTVQDAAESCDKVRYGKERKSLDIDQSEKKTTAIHESGHAVVALIVKNADPVDKVTVIPRGLSLGATHFMPKKNRLSFWKREVLDQLAVLMGGRAAEEIFIGDISSGAQMDISQATRLVRSMICEWGMTDALGTVAYDERSENGQYLGMPGFHEKSYSEATAKFIDDEVRKTLDEAHKKAIEIVQTNRDKVQLMTDMLMEFETLDRDDVQDIMNSKWDTEKKKQRLKLADDLQRKLPPPPPGTSVPTDLKKPASDNPMPQQI
ncbi:MAG TPA: ATP-dependent zinc metalloprotease FtsH [Rhabdochlamydiaceae bacterium]|nr:ATP-dependent zinc metalloprotease FtsH [Rhabdochlamydiaceae bacterium]